MVSLIIFFTVIVLLPWIPGLGVGSQTSTVPMVTTETIETTDCSFINPEGYCSSNLHMFEYYEREADDPVGDISNEVPSEAVVNYTIVEEEESTVFRVDSHGVIYPMAPLDREEVDAYTFTVAATGCQFTKTIPVHVNVLDKNDNIPYWLQTDYHVQWIDGTAARVAIVVVLASDEDIDDNGRLIYVVKPPFDKYFSAVENVVFNIDQLVLSKFLDDDEVTVEDNEFTFAVQVWDNGQPPEDAATDAEIHVKITSQVEEGFENITLQSAFVYENQPIGTYVTTILSETSDDYEVIFVVAGMYDLFEIDPIYGNVTTNRVFNREVKDGYHLIVNGYIADHTTCFIYPIAEELIIDILDMNDNYPIFNYYTSSGSIAENSPPNTTVIMVPLIEATDADINDNSAIVYSLSGDGSYHFQIDELTGIIKTVDNNTALNLDREVRDTYELTVTAADMGGDVDNLNTTISIVIYISDVNDNTPEFNETLYEFELAEDTPVNYVIGTLIAEDYDIGLNGRVLYSTMGGSHGDFDIDKYSGDLFVTGILDRESISSYVINISAYDTGNPVLESYTVVTIDILDINDNSPVFSFDLYIGSIEESAPLDSYVLTVRATDDDEETNADVIYSINSTDFVIDTVTGDVTTASQDFDFEDANARSFEFAVTATDCGNLSSTSVVRVQILDSNDNAPVFTENDYFGYIDENSVSGTTVVINRYIETIDADIGLNAAVVYTLTGEGSDQFQIDNKTGIITSTANDTDLDRENVSSYQLVVTAYDRDAQNGSRSSSAPITILVNDVNDNSPMFQNTFFNFTVMEDTDVGNIIGHAIAEDVDIGINSRLTYTVVSGGEGKFDVNSESGAIFILSQLDREETARYVLNMSVSDSGIDILRDFTKVEIHLLDVNDNSPMFDSDNYLVEVEEELTSGTYLFTVTATDPDAGSNGDVLFSLTTTDFVINQTTGEISTDVRLDFEEDDSRRYAFFALAVDQGEPGLTSTASIKIQLVDINDNAPIFTEPVYYGNVDENAETGTTVIMKRYIETTDADAGRNADVLYTLTGNDSDQFHIDANTGIITTTGDDVTPILDREKISLYHLVVTAHDGTHNSTVPINITVNDVNDNAPLFEEAVYHFNVSEDATVGTTVGLVVAQDMDTGINSRLTYFLVGGSDVLATDRGKPTLTSSASIKIQVVDVNDNAPSFTEPVYYGDIDENSATGTTVTMIPCIDATDSDAGLNASIVYTITGEDSNQFQIDSITGIITTTDNEIVLNLDREDKDVYQLVVTASDRNGLNESLSSIVPIIITINDVNDNAPIFDESYYYFSVSEDRHVGYSVSYVSAYDDDIGINSRLSYFVIDGDGSFGVDPINGTISVLSPLNREITHNSTLTVLVVDGGEDILCDTAKVRIKILDVNDNAPVFDSELYLANVTEKASIGVFVLRVKATDPDEEDNGVVRYRLNSTDFTIQESTGVILTARTFDYEVLVDRQHEFEVYAEDNGLSPLTSTALIRVMVLDVNDNAPIFSQETYKSYALDGMPQGYPIVVTHAYDNDSSSNGEMSYHITENTTDLFRVDYKGVVSVNGLVNYDELMENGLLDIDDSLQFLVVAMDHGVTSYNSSCTINVTITKVPLEESVCEYNGTWFGSNFYQFEVEEHSPQNTFVGDVSVEAYDMEEPVYSILEDYADSVFDVTDDGYIVTDGDIDREVNQTITFTVVIQNQYNTVTVKYVPVHVTVLDINDNVPIFSQTIYITEILEYSSADTFISPVYASDLDSGLRGKISYGLYLSNYFWMDNHHLRSAQKLVISEMLDAGVIFINDVVDVDIYAVDGYGRLGSNNATVRVKLTSDSINNNRTYLNENVSENQPHGTYVVNVTTDAFPSYDIKYGFVESNVTDFCIDETTGEVATAKPLNREERSLYQYSIMVYIDDEAVCLADPIVAELKITVTDENDNFPYFLRDYYYGQVEENDQLDDTLPQGNEEVLLVGIPNIWTNTESKLTLKII
ncbi:cadherin-23-like [Saccoglossus kowalevskii]